MHRRGRDPYGFPCCSIRIFKFVAGPSTRARQTSRRLGQTSQRSWAGNAWVATGGVDRAVVVAPSRPRECVFGRVLRTGHADTLVGAGAGSVSDTVVHGSPIVSSRSRT
jgi:hypothetical protein